MIKNLNKLIQNVPGVVYQFRIGTDGKRRFLYLSNGVKALYECTPEAGCADISLLRDCVQDEDRARLRETIEESGKRLTPWMCDFRIQTPSGITKWIRGQAQPELQDDGAIVWNGILVDATKSKDTEAHLLRLRKMYNAVMEVHQIARKIFDLDEIYREICRIAVELGDMKMAWFGLRNDAEQILNPVARYGAGVGILDEADFFARLDISEGRGQAATALAENRSVLNQDFLRHPNTKRWRDLGRDYGFGSSASFPIREAGRPVAVLTVYREDIGGFDEESVELLERLSSDISYILTGRSNDRERERIEKTLRESESNHRNNFENNSSVMLLIDPASGRISAANKAAVNFFGYSCEQLIGMSMSKINHLSDEDLAKEHQRVLRQGSDSFQFKHRLASGQIRHVEVHLTPIRNSERTLLFAIIHDVTERTRAEDKLRLAATVFSHAREAIMVTSADGTIIDINVAFCRITGYSRDEALGQNPRILKSGRQSRGFYISMWNDLASKGEWQGEIWNRRRNGEEYAEWLTISAVRDAKGVVQQYVALFSDITPQKRHEQELERIAHYDALTSLPNRVLLADRLQHAMVQTRRRGQRLAVGYLDLDGFKAVNDTHGHDVGDQLLMAVAARMTSVLREGDTLARLGGDEFVMVLADLQDSASCESTLRRLLDAVAHPLRLGKLELQVSASLGVTYYPQADGVEADLLLRQADQAMYRAKAEGKNRYAVFDAGAAF